MPTKPSGVTDLPGIACSLEESSENAEGFGFISSGSTTEKPVASGWLTDLHRFMSLR